MARARRAASQFAKAEKRDLCKLPVVCLFQFLERQLNLAFPNRHAKPGKRDATRSRGVCVTLL
jgi:hypothetical protein